MSIPLITAEVIDSIRVQQEVGNKDIDNFHRSYLMDIVRDLKEENPNLLGTIIDSASIYMMELMDNGLSFQRAATFYVNMVNFGCSIYECIKQQMVCNELENSLK